MINWIVPLRRSRRDSQNAYMERLILSSDEEVMLSRRPASRYDRFIRPVRLDCPANFDM